MGIRILKGGMLTTVQDSGRPGYQSQGFGVSGVMDRRSFKIANLLLDNPENEAVLEFTLLGPTLEFTSETIIAITGGDFLATGQRKACENVYGALYAPWRYSLISWLPYRKPRLHRIFQLSGNPGRYGKPLYQHQMWTWRI